MIRNVMSVLQRDNIYFTPFTIYADEPESPDEQSETISNVNESSSIVSSNEGDLAMKEHEICCSSCNKQTYFKKMWKFGLKKKNVNELKKNDDGNLGRYQKMESIRW